jgi:hypothetical protein
VGQGPVGLVGEDLFGLGVAAVVFFGLEHREGRVGEQGVVARQAVKSCLAGAAVWC